MLILMQIFDFSIGLPFHGIGSCANAVYGAFHTEKSVFRDNYGLTTALTRAGEFNNLKVELMQVRNLTLNTQNFPQVKINVPFGKVSNSVLGSSLQYIR